VSLGRLFRAQFNPTAKARPALLHQCLRKSIGTAQKSFRVDCHQMPIANDLTSLNEEMSNGQRAAQNQRRNRIPSACSLKS
jgi:hypothetical protein